MFRSIGFTGGGRVTRILLGGWKLGQALPEVVRVSDPSADSLEKLRRLLPGIERFAGDNDPPASCDIGKCPEVREDSLEAFGLGAKEAEEATYQMVAGAAKTLHESGLSAEDEETIRAIYRTKLPALYRKLKR